MKYGRGLRAATGVVLALAFTGAATQRTQPTLRAGVGGARLGTSTNAASQNPVIGKRTAAPRLVPTTTTQVAPVVPLKPLHTNSALLTPVDVPKRGVSVPLVPTGRLIIPRTGLDQIMHHGIAQNVIDAGPAHWPGTALAGGEGNMVIAGHRTTFTQPFHGNANLQAGDEVIVINASGWRFVYVVDENFVVPSTAMWIKDQAAGKSLTMFTCHPIGSARQRLVTRAHLQSTTPPG